MDSNQFIVSFLVGFASALVLSKLFKKGDKKEVDDKEFLSEPQVLEWGSELILYSGAYKYKIVKEMTKPGELVVFSGDDSECIRFLKQEERKHMTYMPPKRSTGPGNYKMDFPFESGNKSGMIRGAFMFATMHECDIVYIIKYDSVKIEYIDGQKV